MVIQNVRAVWMMCGVSLSMLNPGTSFLMSCTPPTESWGKITTMSTTIPIPPSHRVSWCHINIDREYVSKEISPSTVASVVVKPLINLNSAFAG